jgi:hypothetical protein
MPQVSPRPSADWLQLLTRYGLGTLLALFLVYKLSGSFELKLDALAAQFERHAADTATQTLLLKAICSNTAKTPTELVTCNEAGR